MWIYNYEGTSLKIWEENKRICFKNNKNQIEWLPIRINNITSVDMNNSLPANVEEIVRFFFVETFFIPEEKIQEVTAWCEQRATDKWCCVSFYGYSDALLGFSSKKDALAYKLSF